MEKLKLAVLGSGKGSNFKAIQDQIENGKLHAEVSLVISDVENAGILEFARQHDIEAIFVSPGKFKTKLDFEAEKKVIELLKNARVDLVVLAGFMRILKDPLLNAFHHRIINIHPSLLPKFPGIESWKQALQAGEKVTGCTVHYVDAGMDTGKIIAQTEVPILPGDTSESLHSRVQKAEHLLYPAVIGQFSVKNGSLNWGQEEISGGV